MSVDREVYYGRPRSDKDCRSQLKKNVTTTASITSLGPTQPPLQWVSGALSLGVKRPGHEADHSPPYSTEIKEWVELYLRSPLHLHGVVLSSKMNRDNFTCTFINSMESPSWEPCSHSDSQEVPFLLWKPEIHYRVHISSPQALILNHINPGHTFPICFF
jgi:hypothetical protein